jgi:hypothetical protein
MDDCPKDVYFEEIAALEDPSCCPYHTGRTITDPFFNCNSAVLSPRVSLEARDCLRLGRVLRRSPSAKWLILPTNDDDQVIPKGWSGYSRAAPLSDMSNVVFVCCGQSETHVPLIPTGLQVS